MLYTIRKTFRFEASHVLMYHRGKCSRLHGHSWRCTLEVRGTELGETGLSNCNMVMDFGDLSAVMKPLLDNSLDHWHLNETLDTDSPTSEFVAHWLFDKLRMSLPLLYAVEVEETCTSACRYSPFDRP